ncbi:hypothetical protein [Parvularcula marina]|uniref:Uncharacterized protein n=1 Tax=Parvularcula marina TaxID=2292771 RepID=A0A371RHU9_9PROT|nr:hypothetical protein [Parvularcula marina]RFB05015.1 hypothetical protein DX908_06750 [Parvularcula marina]
MGDDVEILQIPVTSDIGKFDDVENVVLSLAGTAPAANITLPSQPGKDTKYSLLDFKLINTDFSMVASLGFGDMASAKASVDYKYFLSDLALSTDITYPESEDNVIASARFGIGFRIAITTFKMDASFTANIGAVAAASTLKMGYANYEVLTIGGGLEALKAAQPLVASMGGPFDVTSMATLAVVRSELMRLFTDQGSQLTPQLMSVGLRSKAMARLQSGNTTSDYRELLEGQVYAVNRAKGSNRTANQAVADITTRPAWSAVKPEVVMDFYTRTLGLGPDEVPNTRPEVMENLKLIFDAGT